MRKADPLFGAYVITQSLHILRVVHTFVPNIVDIGTLVPLSALKVFPYVPIEMGGVVESRVAVWTLVWLGSVGILGHLRHCRGRDVMDGE